MPGDVEEFVGSNLYMPLPRHVGLVASTLQQLRPCRLGLMELRHAFRVGHLVRIPQLTTGHEHVPARHTNSPAPGARVVCMGKSSTPLDQPIQMRSLHLPMPERRHVVEGHVIGKDEENVWFRRESIRSQQDQESGGEENKVFHGKTLSGDR